MIDNNTLIYFYCDIAYYPQINDFNSLSNVKIFSSDNIHCIFRQNNEKVYDLYIGSSDYNYNWYNAIVEPTIAYDAFFCKYHNNILRDMNIPVIIQKFVYKDDDLLTR